MTTESVSVKSWGAAVGTVLTCLVLGPPLGAIVFVLLLTAVPGFALTSAFEGKSASDMLAGSIGVMLFTLPFSYILGGLQAGFCGLVLAIYGWLKGRPPLWIALVASLFSFSVSYFVDIFGTFADSQHITTVMFITHMVPTILCWLIVQSYWGSRT